MYKGVYAIMGTFDYTNFTSIKINFNNHKSKYYVWDVINVTLIELCYLSIKSIHHNMYVISLYHNNFA